MQNDRTCILMAQETRGDFIDKLHQVLGPDFKVVVCVNEAQMHAAIHQNSPQVLLLDSHFAGDELTDAPFMERIKTEIPGVPILILNRNGDSFSGIEKFPGDSTEGAPDPPGLEPPARCPADQLQSELIYFRKHLVSKLGRLIGSSATMTRIRSQVPEWARQKLPILIVGEIGTGKELLAFEIHRQIPGPETSFISIHQDDIKRERFESDLFGVNGLCEPESQQPHASFWEAATGGTLFIDEITAVPMVIQIQLDQQLERQLCRAVKREPSQSAPVRFMAASTCDLHHLVEKGEFYRPLWQKLRSLMIRIPPLREHAEDIPEIAEYLLEKMRTRARCSIKGISPLALFAMQNYNWPGNVRELTALLEAAVVRCQYEEIQLHDLQLLSTPMPASRLDWSPFCLKEAFDLFRHEYFIQLLKAENGNLAAVAARSGITVQKLQRLLSRLGIDPVEFSN